jgi:phosphohistidine swiveling domain-containing protein
VKSSKEDMKSPYVLTLADPSATLEAVGGKGASLARLASAGLPIPHGFHVTTDAYRRFVALNGLQARILAELQTIDASLATSLETASQAIHQLFVQGEMPLEIEEAIRGAYEELDSPVTPVAVRSSATAEDLPEASFAGQQETYLNVCGTSAVLAAVKNCWASLWTGRAIAYRNKNDIDQNSVALAVVVQEMVNADAAGILFTANPLTGNRDELLINAAWGLGEAIVGGLVSPDTILVEKASGKIQRMDVAEKTVLTVTADTGTQERPLTDARRKSPVLKAAQVSELADLARRIEAVYGRPQDIEWCRANSDFFIVQSRPITALPEPEIPTPTEWRLPKGSYAAMRNNIVELMADPLSPLFATLGLSAINTSLHRLMAESGMGSIMPADIIVTVNGYAYYNGSLTGKSLVRVLFGAPRIMKIMFTGAVERWTEAGRPRYFQVVAHWQATDWRSFPAVELLESARQLTEAAIDAYGALISGAIPAAWITEGLFTLVYNRLIRRRGDPPAATFLLGFDSLPIRADQSLFRLAEWARQEPVLAQYLERTPAAQLAVLSARHLAPGEVPALVWQAWQARLQQHLRDFGYTIYDLDFMHPVPADDPAPVLETLKLYLGGQGADPYARQRASLERRAQAIQGTKGRLTGLRLKWFSKYLASAQKYAPLREDGLAEIGLAYPLIRQMLLEVGQRFARHRAIPADSDVFWLTRDEVQGAAARLDAGLSVESVADTIALRKREHQVALHVIPPRMLPQMKLFGFDLAWLKAKRGRSKGASLKGVAASPGKATGVARILHGPHDFDKMQPGEILVAPITTPAWTPLFALAAAIVTDVGGPLSHGSIVAREYGIPAVLGTGVATRRIRDGQTISVDGNDGTVVLHPG